jgi:hypothetical protein
MMLRRGRIQVLHALALAAGAREPLGRAFGELAAGDPLLEPWRRRLEPALSAGIPVAETLRRYRLIERCEIGAVERSTDLQRTLRRIAAGAGGSPMWGTLLIWLPVVLVLAVGGGVTLGTGVINLTMEQAMRDLNMRLPLGYGPGIAWLATPLATMATAVVVLAGLLLVAAIPGVRRLRHLWCPEVQRAAALAGMIRALASRDEVLAWRRWATWWFLTAQRLPQGPWSAVSSEPLLERRLVGLGLLAVHDGAVDWEMAVERADVQLVESVTAARIVVGPILWIAVLGGFVVGSMGVMIGIIEQLNACSG